MYGTGRDRACGERDAREPERMEKCMEALYRLDPKNKKVRAARLN